MTAGFRFRLGFILLTELTIVGSTLISFLTELQVSSSFLIVSAQIVEEVNENSIIVQVWGQVLPPLFPDKIKPTPLQTKVTAEIKTELIGKLMMMGYNSLDAAIEDFLKS